MKKGTQVLDCSIQKVQKISAKAITPMMQGIDNIGSGKVPTSKEMLKAFTDSWALLYLAC